ncbi:SAM and SH3 domain-containing protein 1-like [Xenia sp. Carnegie-2017]|uniref:SAM and SH3 domain-containing protein 1-like n=1 Tax=Xenia sp. Carnegie-2017 TaxID=2897299 RepID=UPI001F04E750|nr:SAM and SH3 domain-containing protein 1-like [Xenia sp. Carnegie-2017]
MTSNSLPRNAPLRSIANGNLIEDATQDTRTKGEVTSQILTSRQARKVPPKPSPATRVSRHKPSGAKLLEMIEKKLEEEGIDLLQDPYTNQNGKWGVPMTLVDRYSRELKTTMREVAKEMDHIRVEKLDHVKKKAVPCDISSLRFAPDVVGKLSSVVDWLTSLGLPMYIENFLEEGYDDMSIVPYLSHDHLRHANITNTDHIARLIRSLENMAPDPHSYNGD